MPSYVVEIPITGNWVSYRFTGDPFGSSQREARYNQSGVNAFYIADSEETARHEKRFDLTNSELYRVGPGAIRAFDAERFAKEYSIATNLTGTKEQGAYDLCQQLATHLTGQYGLSGVCYPSTQMALQGKTGFCIALLPQNYQLQNGKLLIFERVV